MNSDDKILFDYWDNLQTLKYIDIQKDELSSHEARPGILKILRLGLLDNEISDKPRLRHALKAKELLKELKKIGVEIKPQSLYFHLEKLEQSGFIKTVTIRKEKKHNVAYYGRTAKVYGYYHKEAEYKKYKEAFEDFSKLMEEIDPKYRKINYIKLVEEFLELKLRKQKKLMTWLGENEEIIANKDLDLNKILKVLNIIEDANSENYELLELYLGDLNFY